MAIAMVMPILRCQWRHHCIVTLGQFLLRTKPQWRKENETKGRKAMRAISNILDGDAETITVIGKINCDARNVCVCVCVCVCVRAPLCCR